MQNPAISCVEEKTWWQRNKKKVLIAGSIAVAVVGGILIYKNWDSVTKLAMTAIYKGEKHIPQAVDAHVNLSVPKAVPDSTEPIMKTINGGEAFSVNGHIRNLPASWTPSPEQRTLAEALGITLGDHQTYVRDYMKNCA